MPTIDNVGPADIMAGFSIIPEYAGLSFRTNGLQGGNHSHGSVSTLCVAQIDGQSSASTFYNSAGAVSSLFEVKGDWETYGLIMGLIDLGRKLDAQYPGEFDRFIKELEDDE